MTNPTVVTAPLLASLAGLLLVGCPEATPPSPSYPPQTTLTLAGSTRCKGASCTCRPLDADEGQKEEGIPPGHKRFELRLPRSTSAI